MQRIPYGNVGPDCKIRFTRRLAHELRNVVRGHHPDSIEAADWNQVYKIMSEARSLAGSTSRLTVNLGRYQPEVLVALREALILVEKTNTHVQIYTSAHARAEEIADYLDISAVERLGEIGADLKTA